MAHGRETRVNVYSDLKLIGFVTKGHAGAFQALFATICYCQIYRFR